jgi:hypothetical protein
MVKCLLSDFDNLENVMPTIITQWGRTARSEKKGILYTNSMPEKFGEHVGLAHDIMKDKLPEHKILVLKSWNEWGEGNYMGADKAYGYGYLNAVKSKILN